MAIPWAPELPCVRAARGLEMLQGGARASHGGDGLSPLIPPAGPTTHNHSSPPQGVHSFVSFAFPAPSTDLGM